MQDTIHDKIKAKFQPTHCEVINESHKHNVPPGSESHFKLIVVSTSFSGKNLVSRHREINSLLQNELQNGVHALSLTTLTPEEWHERGGKIEASPPCLGGSKHDH